MQKIKEYKGNKSQKIYDMIDNKLHQEEKKNLLKYKRDRILTTTEKAVNRLRKELTAAENKLKRRRNELGIQKASHYKNGEWVPDYTIIKQDRVPMKDHELLQSASNLFALGKRVQAEKIWDKLIKKYNLDGAGK